MTVANNQTVREDAMQYLKSMLEAMQQTANGGTFAVQFSDGQVYREPPEDLLSGKLSAAVLLEHNETKSELISTKVDCQLVVYVEVHIMRQPNQKPQNVLNLYLGETERCIRADRTLGGFCWDVSFNGVDTAPEGPYKSYASGVLRITLKYRHSAFDPRQQQ